jgi:hypothetical protein
MVDSTVALIGNQEFMPIGTVKSPAAINDVSLRKHCSAASNVIHGLGRVCLDYAPKAQGLISPAATPWEHVPANHRFPPCKGKTRTVSGPFRAGIVVGDRVSQGVAAGLVSGCTFGAGVTRKMRQQQSPNQAAQRIAAGARLCQCPTLQAAAIAHLSRSPKRVWLRKRQFSQD